MNKNFLIISILFYVVAVYAQDDKPYLTPNATDPTEVRTKLNIALAELTSLAGSDLLGMRFSGDYKVASWASLGMAIPFVYTDLKDGQGSGMGDISVNMLAVLSQNSNWPNEAVT